MPEQHSDDAILVHLSYLKDGVDEMRDLLKAQNGRIRESELAITKLETRASEAKVSGRNWGGAAGALGGFVSGLLSGWLGK